MPDVASASSFDDEIPAFIEPADDEIPASLEPAGEADEIPVTESPDQTVVSLLSQGKTYSERARIAANSFDNPTLRPYFVKALAAEQKAKDSRSASEKAAAGMGAAIRFIPAVNDAIGRIVTETVPAVIGNIYNIAGEGHPLDSTPERARAYGEAMAAIQTAVTGYHGIVRKTKENLSDAFTFDKNKVGTILSREELLKQATGQNPAVVNTQDEYETRAEADVVEAMTLAEAAKGALLPAHVRKQLEAKGAAIRPDVVGALSEAYDPQNVLEFGLGAAVGKSAAKAAGKEVVATGLLKAAPVTEPGFAARAVSSVFGAAGEKLVKASDNPVIVGTLAGSAVALSGGDPTTVVLAAVLGAGSTRKSGMVSSALEKSGGALVRVGDQFAGRASLGPMGRFAEGALAFSKPALRGGGAGLVASAPFALGSRDEDDVLNTVAGGVAFGLGGGLVGSTYAKAADKFAIHNVFKSKADAKPDSAYERPEYTPYSPDSGHPLEVESKRVFDTLSNRGAQTVEVLKKLFSKPGEDGMKTEIYLGGQAAADAFAKSMGLDSTRAGVTIELPKEGRRVVFINADSNGGISLGHEVGHGFIESLPAAEKKQMVDTGLELLFKNGQFFTLRDRYAEKFNTVRDAAGNLVQKPKDQWVYRDDEYYVKEYLAENFSAYLNGIPIEKFGTPRSLADRIRISIGSRLEKAGARKLTADGSAAVQTPLGYKPSAALAEMFDNFMQARKLENTTLPGETPPEVGVPPVLEKPEAKPATPAPAEPVPAVTPEPAAVTPTPEATPTVAPEVKVDQAEINRRASLLRKAREQLALANELGANADVIAKAQERVAAQEAFFDAAFPAETPAPASTPAPATPKTTPTAEDLVAPKQVENVVRPEAPAPTPGAKSLRPKAAEAFVEKATDEVHLQNRKDFEGLMSAPRGQIPVVEVTTRGAASPVESPDAVVRAAQRKAADALEKSGQPNPFRQAFQKLFVPYRWATYKLSEAVNARLYGKDAPRQPGGVYGMSVDKVGQNLDLLRGIALENPKIAETLARSGFDAAYLSSPEIVSDFRKYLENQANGFGGGGERLVRPADTRPGSITPEATGFVPNKLSPEKRQLFNLLLNFEQQSSRTAGMEFSARFAKQNGIDPLTVGFDEKGRPLTENNALRASLIKQGFDPRILNSAVENLPTENFTSPLKVRPDIKFPAADVAISQAGFMPETGPRTDVLSEVERALRYTGYSDPGRSSLTEARRLLQDPSSDVADITRKLDMARMYTSYSHPSRDAVYKAGQLAAELGNASFMPETSSPRRPQGNDETRSVAAQYAEKAGIRAKQHDVYAPTDEATLKRIADFYESAKHEPNRPEVEKAYRALAEETRAQYDEMVANGIKIEPFEAGKGEPYPNSAAMLADVRDNKHLYFFKTENAYGAGDPSDAPSGNALLEKSGIKINGHDLLYNDLFRAVHDYFGHTAEGFEFGPRGEYNAYLAHSRMFSDAAKPALAAETLAQNAWVNFGPQLRRTDGSLPKAGDVDFVPIAKRRFADQKNTVVPEELLRAADPQASFMPEAPDTPEFKKWFGDWEDPKAFSSRAKGPVSYVVDSKGKPMRVYHATTEDFTTFESGRKTFDDMGLLGNVETNRHAIFFSDSPDQASSYAENRRGKPYEGAKIVPAYLSLQGPADFTRRSAWDIAEEVGINPRWTQYKQTWELFDGPDGKEFVEALKKEGYDGAIFTEDAVREGVTPGTTYAVFEPTQIKSATGNRGTFDPTNPDIRYMPEQLDAPEKLPHAVRNKTLTLIHKGTAGLSEIDPARFGSSKITPRSELSGEPRSYYYVKGFENKSDPVMGRGTSYEIPVSGKRIYNGDTDPLDWSQEINRQKADLMLKDAGYAGVIRTRGEGKNKFKQVELFEKVSTNGEPVSETDVRTPRSRLETPEGREVAARLREKYGSTGAYFDRLNKYKETGEISFMPETPEFKTWFGDSKVVDESGAPKRMYHGTNADFTVVDPDAGGREAFFVTENPEFASDFAFERNDYEGMQRGALYPVYVKSERPFNYENSAHIDAILKTPMARRELSSRGPEKQTYVDELKKGDWSYLEQLIPEMKKLGFDGVYVREAGEKNLGVFRPEQIKSATGNNGNFDPKNPDIRFMPEATLDQVADQIVVEKKKKKGKKGEEAAPSVPKTFGERYADQAVFPEAVPLTFATKKDGSVVYGNDGPKIVTQPYDFFDTTLTRELGINPEDLASLKTKLNTMILSEVKAGALGKLNEGEKAAMGKMVEAYAQRAVDDFSRYADDPQVKAAAGWYSDIAEFFKKIIPDTADRTKLLEFLGGTSPNTDVETNFLYALDLYNRYKKGELDGYRDRHNELVANFDSLASTYAEQVPVLSDSGKPKTAGGQPVLRWQLKEGAEKQYRKDYYEALVKDGVKPGPARQRAKNFSEGNLWTLLQLQNDVVPRRSGEGGGKYGMHSDRILQIMNNEWREQTDAPKAPNFTENLAGLSTRATIDVWAARWLRRLGYDGLTDGKWRLLPMMEQGVGNADFFLGQQIFEKTTDRINKELGEKLGRKINPDDLQAIMWFAEKREWSRRGWSVFEDLGDFRNYTDRLTPNPDGTFHLKDVTLNRSSVDFLKTLSGVDLKDATLSSLQRETLKQIETSKAVLANEALRPKPRPKLIETHTKKLLAAEAELGQKVNTPDYR